MTTPTQAGTLYVAGNVDVDLILGPLAQWPRVGTETILPHSDMRAGGQAGNTGLALAALGARHRIVANMGDDPLGEWLRDSFPQSGPHWPHSSAAATLTVGIVHPGGERTFFTTVGHLAEFKPDHILSQLPEIATEGDTILVCGVFLSPLLVAGCRQLFDTLKDRGFATALDTGWPNEGWDSVRAEVASWLPRIDHVLFNELETTALSKLEKIDEAARWFMERLPPGATLVVKRGAAGAVAWRRDERVGCPAEPVRVIDTIGAGDAFNAGYLLEHATGGSLAHSVHMGVRTASAAISTLPRRFVPDRMPPAG
jgi:sugar/nucleoside kinase (ribokinase family)